MSGFDVFGCLRGFGGMNERLCLCFGMLFWEVCRFWFEKVWRPKLKGVAMLNNVPIWDLWFSIMSLYKSLGLVDSASCDIWIYLHNRLWKWRNCPPCFFFPFLKWLILFCTVNYLIIGLLKQSYLRQLFVWSRFDCLFFVIIYWNY